MYLGNNDYGRIEALLNMYVSRFIFSRGLRPNNVSHLEWDLYGFNLVDRGEDNVWDAYHVQKVAQYFPSRVFLITDEFTWKFFDEHRPNIVLMDQPNWPNIIINYLELRDE